MASMKASVAMGTLAFVVLGLSTSAYADNVDCKRFFPSIGKTLTVACVETKAKPKDEPKAPRNVGCKRFFPSIGKTLTVPCE